MGYQPPVNHPVFFNGSALNTQNWQTGTDGVLIRRVSGWDDAPDVRDTRELNAGRDGELADNLYLGGRVIVIEGMVSGATYADLQAKKAALVAKLIPSATEYVLKMPLASNTSPSWTHADSMTDFERVTARVVEGVQFGENEAPLLQPFAVTLKASDPRIYSDTLTTVDSGTTGTAARTATISNTGIVPTPVEITVTGPYDTSYGDWVVKSSDGALKMQFYNNKLSASMSTTINTKTRTVVNTETYLRARANLTGTTGSVWLVNETSGTTANDSKSAKNGTYNGGFTLNQAGPSSGLSSVLLDGTSGYIELPSTIWDVTVRERVFELWFKPTDFYPAALTRLFDSNYAGGSGMRFDIKDDEHRCTFRWFHQTAAGVTGSNNTGISKAYFKEDGWNQLIITTGLKHRIVVNGVDVIKPETDKYLRIPTTVLRVGALQSAAGSYFSGYIGPMTHYAATAGTSLDTIVARMLEAKTATPTYSTIGFVDYAASVWGDAAVGSTTYTLPKKDSNTGTKLSVSFRNARL